MTKLGNFGSAAICILAVPTEFVNQCSDFVNYFGLQLFEPQFGNIQYFALILIVLYFQNISSIFDIGF